MLNGYKILVYCTSRIHESNFNYFISALNDDLVLHGWRILIFSTLTDLFLKTDNSKGEAKIFDLINYEIADAVFVSNENLLNYDVKNNILQKAKAHNIPAFLFGGTDSNYFNIGFNHKLGIRKITKHIIEEHNVTDLHFLCGRKDSDISNERLEAFKEVLAEHKITFDDSMVSYGDFWDDPAKKAVQKLVDEGRVPGAIICANDSMAIAAISVLRRNGYKCPRDVLVTGFDGIEYIFYSNPKITSAMCSYQMLGIEVAKFILQIDSQIKENPNLEPFSKFIEPTLILSESCGCASSSSSNIFSNQSLDFITNLGTFYNLFRDEEYIYSQLSFSIQECANLDEVAQKLHETFKINVKCFLKAECISDENCPNVSHTKSVYGDMMYVLFDSTSPQNEKKLFRTNDLVYNIDELFDIKKPLIFSPLNHIDLTLGYLVFYFDFYHKENFNRVSQITTWISNAIFGFRVLKYQHFLQNRIERMYSLDALSGLYNRTAFLKMFEPLEKNDKAEVLTLVMCDLDNLKMINDTYGHAHGDIAIKTVANAFLSSFSPEECICCRYGGDEILALFTKEINDEYIEEKINNYIDEYNMNSNNPYKVSASIGICSSHDKNFESMLSFADELMYKKKMAKKNRRK